MNLDTLLSEKKIKTAVFDIDDTVSFTNFVMLYCFLKSRKMKEETRIKKALWLAGFISFKVPEYLLLDCIDRKYFLGSYVNSFSEFTVEEIDKWSEVYFNSKIKKLIIPETERLIRKLKSNGVKVELLSMTLDILASKYAKYFDCPYHALKTTQKNGHAYVDKSQIRDFKLREVRKFDSGGLLAAADSRHDLPVLRYAQYAVIVGKDKKKWMDEAGRYLFLHIRSSGQNMTQKLRFVLS
ncbi:MAG: HAD family hydrolase [Oscillospiraceae bacterium]|nr:HAD family hydrolase [Oscillospiraceae bacterium]